MPDSVSGLWPSWLSGRTIYQALIRPVNYLVKLKCFQKALEMYYGYSCTQAAQIAFMWTLECFISFSFNMLFLIHC